MKHVQRPFMAELQKAKRNAAATPGGPAADAVAGSSYAAVSAAQAAAQVAAPAAAPALAGVVSVDNTAVLRAISELGSKLDRFLTMDAGQIDQIQVELADISGRIKATKMEMAALRHPLAGDDKFQQASEELTAVVSATEAATNGIMACAEELEEIISELKASMPEGYQADRVNDMSEVIIRIYEACNFQDLTGQRITKVVRALSFIEERVDAMIGLWNRRELEAMPLPPTVTKMDGSLELHGPAEQGVTGNISQDDIDALFG